MPLGPYFRGIASFFCLATFSATLTLPALVPAQQAPDAQSASTWLANTQSANTQSANTQSANTQSANTQSANTQSANTQSANTQSDSIQSDSIQTDNEEEDSGQQEDSGGTERNGDERAESDNGQADDKQASSDKVEDGEGETGNHGSAATSDSAKDSAAAKQRKEASAKPKPRFQSYVPSMKRLIRHVMDSLPGKMTAHIVSIVEEATAGLEDVDTAQLDAVFQAIRAWPDTDANLALFTPDVQGQARWIVRLGMPIGQTHDLLAHLLTDSETAEFFEGVTETVDNGAFAYAYGDRQLAILAPAGTDACSLRSHSDIGLPSKFYQGASGEGELVLASRLEVKKTEKDSGATFFSNFSLVSAVAYSTRIDDQGQWHDQVKMDWPFVSGMAMKALVGKTKQTFFVPNDAFLGAVFNFVSSHQLLEQSANLTLEKKPNVPGPIQRYGGDEVLVTVLPGTGFLPVPDIVAQCRVSQEEKALAALEARIKRLNEAALLDELPEPWQEFAVDDLRVFWCDKKPKSGSSFVPFRMRPVLFFQQAKDAKGRDRSFLITGWTSTTPERFVRDWLDRPRTAEEVRFLPQERSKNLEGWLHWQQLYDWVHPYVNLSLRSVSADGLLPVAWGEDIPDASIHGEFTLGGMKIVHQGPVPLGLAVVPIMASFGTGETRGSDIARERLANRQLQVLYHHSKLFRQDTGRWPSEVAELDGYIDFTGNRQLLKLAPSSKKQIGKLFGKLFGQDDDDEDEENNGQQDDVEDELYGHIDDSIYVVNWTQDDWQLGYAEGQLDHLEELYIDEDGVIHRVEKVENDSTATETKKAT